MICPAIVTRVNLPPFNFPSMALMGNFFLAAPFAQGFPLKTNGGLSGMIPAEARFIDIPRCELTASD